MNNCFLMRALNKQPQPGWSFWLFSRKGRERDMLSSPCLYHSEYYAKRFDKGYFCCFCFLEIDTQKNLILSLNEAMKRRIYVKPEWLYFCICHCLQL